MRNIKRAYGTTDIARMCYVTPPTVGRWIEEGKLPCFRTAGGHRRVWDKDLIEFLKVHGMPVPRSLLAGRIFRVLIVDDEAQVRKTLKRQLSTLYPSVEQHEACDGFEAGHKLAQLAPDLVLLDFFLPGMDGGRICKLIRSDESLKHVRVLAISGQEIERTRQASMESGADDFLPKPFSMQELKQKLSGFIPKDLEAGVSL
ncbi:MAG: response regulator [Elusimicrobiota bacterium]